MNRLKNIIVGVDASRNRSGGACLHLIRILSLLDPYEHGISIVHVWTFHSLLIQLPTRAWLVKHDSNPNNSSLYEQLLWQARRLSGELQDNKCDILFTTDASTLCQFKPMVVLSQDLLSYEPGVMRTFGFGLSRLRLLAIYFLQNRAFRGAYGVIFLTKYAANTIQKSCGKLSSYVIIPHGVDDRFQNVVGLCGWPSEDERALRCVYVSNAEMYKHQWSVIDAIGILRQRGLNVELKLIGGGSGRAQMLLSNSLGRIDPKGNFIQQIGFITQDKLLNYLTSSDVFIFASSCEAFGITLLEGMSLGLPIACSNRSSLPETLKDGGIYFDPLDPISIAKAVLTIVKSKELRLLMAVRAKHLSLQYSWERCTDQTWSFVVSTYHGIQS